MPTCSGQGSQRPRWESAVGGGSCPAGTQADAAAGQGGRDMRET